MDKDNPIANGSLYQFREKIELGRKLANDRKQKLMDNKISLFAKPSDVELVRESDKLIRVCLTMGFNSAIVNNKDILLGYRGKLIAVADWEDFDLTQCTIWKVETCSFVKISNYRYLTCSYTGSVEV